MGRVDMMPDLPSWCRYAPGRRPVLLVAPHGGRRPPVDAAVLPPHLRVNDLYTADVAAMVASRLDATTIINAAEDRNRLDLNRISQTRRRAPWFLDLLAHDIHAMVAAHGYAEVVFVHGWNDGQVKCDIGIGATAVAGRVVVPTGAGLTVGVDYLHRRLHAVRAVCEDRGIAVGLGLKYPASHPNTLVQLFGRGRTAGHDPMPKALADAVAADRVHAWQLELSIPLRWPGPWRERLIDALTTVLATPAGVDRSARSGGPSGRTGNAFEIEPQPVRAEEAPSFQGPSRCPHKQLATDSGDAARLTWPESLPDPASPGPGEGLPAAVQCYDPVADIGIVAGVGPIGPSATGGRLLLFLGGQRVGLFTGETSGPGRTGVAPLHMVAGAERIEVTFEGALLVLSDAGLYVDLEAALAASTLEEVSVCLSCVAAADRGVQVGRLHGTVRVGAAVHHVDAPAVVNAVFGRHLGPEPQAAIAAAFDGDSGVVCRAGTGPDGALALSLAAGRATPLSCLGSTVRLDGDRCMPARLRFALDGGPSVDVVPVCRMPILRQSGGRYVRVTFGIAQVRWGGRDGFGLYEHAVAVEV